ncbi:glycosyltransferase family 2 protein [Candidatus Auribacterota bacterium]
MTKKIYCSIIIVTWNVEKLIKTCLGSIYNQTFRDYEIIVVDNNSTDATKKILKENLSNLSIIENKTNKGFAYANNQGIKQAKGDYILCLNSDVILDENFLLELTKGAQKSPATVGTYTGKLLTPNQHIYSTGLSLSRARRFKNDTKEKENMSIIWGANAAAVLYKKKMLEDITILEEYFDSDFFFLVEDVDLAYRAKLLGWKTLYLKNALGYHLGNCSNYPKSYRQYLSFRNRYFLLIKNESLLAISKNILYIIPYDFLRAIYLLFSNKYFLKGIKEIIQLSPRMFAKRREIKRKRRKRL